MQISAGSEKIASDISELQVVQQELCIHHLWNLIEGGGLPSILLVRSIKGLFVLFSS